MTRRRAMRALLALRGAAYLAALYAGSVVLAFAMLSGLYGLAVVCCADLPSHGDPSVAFTQGMIVVGAFFAPPAVAAAFPLAYLADRLRRVLCRRLRGGGAGAAA